MAREENVGKRFPTLLHGWGVLTLVILLMAAFWTCVAIWARNQEAEIVAANQRELVQLNIAVNQQAEGMFRSVEAGLQVLDRWLQANPGIDPRTDARFASVADDLRRTSDGLVDPRLVSPQGELFYVPTLDLKSRADVSDRPYFREQIDHPEKRILYISDPVVSRVTKKWGIPISWRLEQPVAGIAVVFGNIELDRLSLVHEKLRKKPNGTIALIRTDGVVLSRTPFVAKIMGENISSSRNYQAEFGKKESGSFVSETATDGVRRLVSYSRLTAYPVILLVTEGYEDALADWHAQRNELLIAAALVTLTILLAAFLLQRSLRATSIAQSEMRILATTDSLTGVMNRRMFLDLAQREFSRAWRYGRPMALLALDLDHFKNVNDTFGHAAGDTVLRECARAWQAELREQDLLGRIGGEEFAVILPETPPDTAQGIAERLRQTTRRLKFSGLPPEFAATVSIGVAVLSRSDEQLAHLMERADRALYQAKERGRDRVESADTQPPQGVSQVATG